MVCGSSTRFVIAAIVESETGNASRYLFVRLFFIFFSIRRYVTRAISEKSDTCLAIARGVPRSVRSIARIRLFDWKRNTVHPGEANPSKNILLADVRYVIYRQKLSLRTNSGILQWYMYQHAVKYRKISSRYTYTELTKTYRLENLEDNFEKKDGLASGLIAFVSCV